MDSLGDASPSLQASNLPPLSGYRGGGQELPAAEGDDGRATVHEVTPRKKVPTQRPQERKQRRSSLGAAAKDRPLLYRGHLTLSLGPWAPGNMITPVDST
ncbi:hypothetical protein GCM10009647_058350 [Streptomyces sanglieri]